MLMVALDRATVAEAILKRKCYRRVAGSAAAVVRENRPGADQNESDARNQLQGNGVEPFGTQGTDHGRKGGAEHKRRSRCRKDDQRGTLALGSEKNGRDLRLVAELGDEDRDEHHQELAQVQVPSFLRCDCLMRDLLNWKIARGWVRVALRAPGMTL